MVATVRRTSVTASDSKTSDWATNATTTSKAMEVMRSHSSHLMWCRRLIPPARASCDVATIDHLFAGNTALMPDVPRLPVLRRMARDVYERGSVSRSSAIAMWVAYATHLGGVVIALARSDRRLPVPEKPARSLGPAACVAGTALTVAGMRSFATLGEVEGTRNDALTTNGVYRYSRNPQYLGYLLLLGGAAIWRRSGVAALLAAGGAVVYREWIPVEEAQLSRLYGEPYRQYTGRVNRWWGRRW